MDAAQKTVLIVDDTAVDTGIIAGALKGHFKTVVATNGARALSLASADDKPDLILLDVMMSGMDGYEVCRRLRTNLSTRDIPVIFLTAKTDVEDEQKGFELGAVDYVHKPFSAPIVLARVTAHVALQVALREARNLTDRLRLANKELEDRVAAALEREQTKQAELARVTRITTMDAFTASLAHELNQPLAAVVANSGAALRWLSSARPNHDEVRAALKRIGEDSHRASQMIVSLQAMFKKEDNRRSVLAVNALISDTLLLVQGASQKHEVSIKTELLDDLPNVLADRTQLQQVLINLMLNGMEAMDSITNRDRLLVVKSGVGDRGSVIVRVEDSGAGINPNDLDHIFDAFFTTKSGGMGIGLSICQSIIEAHGGRLWASRRTPHGSVFHVELPGGDL
jgi:signal transduction histidine kinase